MLFIVGRVSRRHGGRIDGRRHCRFQRLAREGLADRLFQSLRERKKRWAASPFSALRMDVSHEEGVHLLC